MTSHGNAATNGASSAAGGAFKTIHGAGEVLRGTINSVIDTAGEHVAGRGDNEPVSASGERSKDVASKGMSEFRAGLDAMRGRKTNTAGTMTEAEPTTATATSTAAHPAATTAPTTLSGASTAPQAGPTSVGTQTAPAQPPAHALGNAPMGTVPFSTQTTPTAAPALPPRDVQP